MPKFVPVTGVMLEDQFRPSVMTVTKPTMLCAPANINDQQPGAETHAGLLLCYRMKRPPETSKFTTVTPAYINNQWGPDQLCVLSQIVP
jgi:hypothetical protein